MKIVDYLRGDPGPVDRVDGRKACCLAECRVGEHCLYQVLAVVKRPLDCDAMHICGKHGCHLTALHLRHAAVRVQYEDVDCFPVPAGFNGCRSRIARGCADDGDALTAACQDMIEEASDELHRIVLERQSGAVEQLHQPKVCVELFNWGDGIVREAGVGVFNHGGEIGFADPVSEEGCHHPNREFRILHSLHRTDIVGRKRGPGFRKVKTSVGGQSG